MEQEYQSESNGLVKTVCPLMATARERRRGWPARPDLDCTTVKPMRPQRGSYTEDTQLFPFYEYIFINTIIPNKLTVLSKLSGYIFPFKI